MNVKWFVLLILVSSFSYGGSDYSLSDHYDGKKFFNPEKNDYKTIWDLLKWYVTGDKKPWPQAVANKVYPMPDLAPDTKAVVTFINHATFLIRLQGLTILTDPVFSERMGPIKFVGPKRVRSPGINFEMLPKIDVVVISHNHFDHMDLETLTRLDGKFHPMFVVPIGNGKFLKQQGLQNVTELDWWDKFRVQDKKILLTPAQHWSSRNYIDKCDALWGGYMIYADGVQIYFAGDTGYGSHFAELKKRLGPPQLSLLPVGGYSPRSFMEVNHLNPEDAVKAHIDLGSPISFAMHFGTFQLSDEGIDEPILDLKAAMKKLGVNQDSFKTLDHGESYAY